MREWTEEEVCRLRELKAQGLTFRQIGDQIGRTHTATKAHWAKLHKSPEQLRAIQEANSLRRRERRIEARGTTKRLSAIVKVEPKLIVPNDVWAERNARLMARPVDLTGWVFGDPVFSQSALAKKQASGAGQ